MTKRSQAKKRRRSRYQGGVELPKIRQSSRIVACASIKGPDRMANYIKIALVMIALMVGLTAAFQLYLEISGVLVQAAYAPNLSFTGISHFGRATYAGFSWFQNLQKPGPCPLVIHLADRDLGAEDLGNVER